MKYHKRTSNSWGPTRHRLELEPKLCQNQISYYWINQSELIKIQQQPSLSENQLKNIYLKKKNDFAKNMRKGRPGKAHVYKRYATKKLK